MDISDFIASRVPRWISATRRLTPFAVLLGIALTAALQAAPARGCDVPVFRYALERWPSDPYEAVLFYAGGAGPVLDRALDRFGTTAGGGHRYANLRVRTVDAGAALTEADRALLAGSQVPFPQMVLLRPGMSDAAGVVWRGAATPEAADALVGSPARTRIARSLLDGQSAVFVLVTGADPDRDDAAERLARETLAAAPGVVSLPAPGPGSGIDPAAVAGLRVAFSLIRIARDDPAEQPLVSMLLGTEWDLSATRAPVLLPVFGRGRVLYALVGDGITHENILRACAFLVGPCACEIKQGNPGTDLLMSVDWVGGLRERVVDTAALDAVAAASNYVELAAASTAGRVSGGADDVPPPRDRPLARNLGVVLVAVFSAVAAFSIVVWFHGR